MSSGGQVFPASFAQQRLWFLEQLEDAGAAYNVRLPVRLTGVLDPACLEAALAAIVRRHESLRTTFSVEADEPVQVVHEELPVPLEIRPAPPGGEEGLRELLGTLAAGRFELSRGPLFRAVLVTIAPDDHALLLVAHHIISDAWSSGLIFRDLMAVYEAGSAHRAPELPELPVQYADFAVWQREWLRGGELDRQAAYWTGQLAGAPVLLELPTDRPRPAVQTHRGHRLNWRLDKALTAGLESLARAEGATLFMVLFAAFNALLSRWTGQQDLVIGTPVAGRRRTELENVVGFFANTLALRTRLDGCGTFRELLGQVRADVLRAFDHQDLPFEKLVEVLAPPRRLSHPPVFQVLFGLQNSPWEARPVASLGFSPAEMAPPPTARFDLAVSAVPFEGEIWLGLEYNTDLFDADTIARLAGGYEALLAAVVANPAAALPALPSQSAAERARVLRACNQTATPLPDTDVYGLFAAQAARTPAAVAVEEGNAALSYGDLAARTESIAAALRARGVGPGSTVALCLERTAWLPAAMLGVLRCGAHYLPLDPAHPAPRLAFILADAEASHLLVDNTARGLVAGFAGAVVELPLPANADPLPPTPGPLAYLIYTSGSTGQPKGVAVPRPALLNFLLSMAREPGLGPGDRLLAITTPAFDISALELLLPLTVGATTVIASRDETRDARLLARRLEQSRITVLQATPATWRNLLAAGWTGRPSLRLLCGGEALEPALAAALLPLGQELWNLYGPTETTVWSCCTRISSAAAPVSVGGPIANTRCYILDEQGEPVPAGVRGELWIGGTGVAAGYHRRPDLTAGRFRPDPFVDKPFPGEDSPRMYRTGDRARRRADGTLEILGRTDLQLKVRGFRIEPGEVETELWALPGVAAALVAARGERLVAWFVPAPGANPDPPRLRELLARRLPDYMVPDLLVSLPALPLTPNGKVDRAALPDPAVIVSGGAPLRVPPRNSAEAAVCRLMAQLLERPEVGINEDFFALGGHSLLATRLLARLRDALEVELPLRSVFLDPTPAGIAAAVATARPAPPAGPALAPAPPVADVTAARTAPLSLMQQRLWFLDRLQPGNPVYNLVWAFRLEGELDRAALGQALARLAARHEVLRTAITEVDGEGAQRILPGVDLPVRTRSVTTDELSATLRELGRQPFDLTAAPLLRVHLLETGPAGAVLMLVIHHIVADGWSLSVLCRELSAAYVAACRGETPGWAPLPLQYADYARWQRERLAGGGLEGQLGYWRRALAGAPPFLELLPERARPALASHRGARHGSLLPATTLDGLRTLARAAGGSLFMALLAGFALVLGRYGGTEDVVVGTPVAGRNQTGLEGLIGFFINTLVLRTDLTGNPTFRELLDRVKAVSLGAFEHGDLPFEQLVEALALPRDTRRTPLVQVLLNLHNEPAAALDLPGLAVTPVGVDRGTAKFDLSIALTETADGLAMQLEYSTDLYTPAWADRFATDVARVLAAAAAEPDGRLATLGLPPAPESVSVPLPAGTLPEALTAALQGQPGRTVLVAPGEVWNAGELADHVERIAAALHRLGAAAGPRVGLWFGHGAGQVAGILGVLRAGRACVPLDPLAPPARLEKVVRDAELRVVVTEEAALATWPALVELVAGGLTVLVRERLSAGELPPMPADADAIAYVLYTSGSTGTPKAVPQTHRNALFYVTAWARQLDLGPEDRLSLFATYGYDAAIQDIFAALLAGAELHPLDIRAMDRDAVLDRIAAGGLTALHATPTVYRHLFGGHVACRQDLSRVRLVVLGGEEARRSDLDLFRARFRRGARLVNGYGLTEATAVLQSRAGHEDHPYGLSLPLGWPVGGLPVGLVDMDGKPATICGELVLPAERASPGYLTEGGGITRTGPGRFDTGDLARRLPDGSLAWTGRRDARLKLGGIRLEPGEIEAALLAHPALAGAAVVVDETGPEPALLAWLVPVPGCPIPAVDTLRRHLGDRLPASLIPARFAPLPQLPRRPNGKVDRQALPPPPPRRAPVRPGPPAGELPVLLAGLWAELLGRESVGPEEDFFALGGHSLLALRLIARVRERLDVELPLLAVFEHPTVAGLARVIGSLPPRQAGAAPLRRQVRPAAGRTAGGANP